MDSIERTSYKLTHNLKDVTSKEKILKDRENKMCTSAPTLRKYSTNKFIFFAFHFKGRIVHSISANCTMMKETI